MIDHETYKENYHTCLDWIASARRKLHQNNDMTGSNEDVDRKLQEIQVNLYHN